MPHPDLLFVTGKCLVYATAGLAAVRCLWWGLHPAVGVPLRMLVIPAELAWAATEVVHAQDLLVTKNDSFSRVGFVLLVVAVIALITPWRVDVSAPYDKWKCSVCMVTGAVIVCAGAIPFCSKASVAVVFQICAYLGEALVRTWWEMMCGMVVFLWPYMPGVWESVAIASLCGSAMVLAFIDGLPEMRVIMVYYACRFVPASYLVFFCCWGSLPRIAMDLAMTVPWLLVLMLTHLSLRIGGGPIGPQWFLLACTTFTVAWTAVIGLIHDNGEWHRELVHIFKIVGALQMPDGVLTPLLKNADSSMWLTNRQP